MTLFLSEQSASDCGAAAMPAQPSVWLPIETAPQDGTRVLMYRVGWRENTAVTWFNQIFGHWTAVTGFAFFEPTHWMPLPEPPQEAAAPPTNIA